MKFKNQHGSLLLSLGLCIILYFALLRLDTILQLAENLNLILRPFLFGLVIAYLMAPLCQWGENFLLKRMAKSGKPTQKQVGAARGASILLAFVLVAVLFYLFLSLVIPQLISSLTSLVSSLPYYYDSIVAWLEKFLKDSPYVASLFSDYSEQFSLDTSDFIESKVLPYLESIASTFGILKDLMVGLFAAIYLLLERKTFIRQSKMLVRAVFRKGNTADWILSEVTVLNGYLTGFIKGKLIDSLIIGILCGICTTALGIPYAMLVSVIVGITNIIPFFGPFLGAIPSALLILMVSPTKCIVFLIFIVILQQFDGNLLGPKILGNATNLSSFWILFSIILFGGLMGITGMVIGVPVFGFVYHLVKGWVHQRLSSDPAPDDPA